MRSVSLAVALMVVGVASCYSPSIAPCHVACNNGACPNGLACNDQGICAATPTATCVDSGTGDANADDAGSEGTVDAAVGSVSVLALDLMNQPISNATVIFTDENLVTISTQVTDVAGLASFPATPAGGTVTVIRNVVANNLDVTTFVDVWPGARLTTQHQPNVSERQITVNWSPINLAYDQMLLVTSCGTSVFVSPTAQSAMINVSNRCPSFDVTLKAVASATAGLAPLFTVTADASESTISMPAWSAGRTVLGTFTNLPSNIHPSMATLAEAISWQTATLAMTADLSTGVITPTTLDVQWEIPNAGGMTAAFTLRTQGSGVIPVQEQYELVATPPVTFAKDFALSTIPWVHSLATDLTTRELRWTTIAPQGITPAAPNVAFGRMRYTLGGQVITWHLIAPGSRITNAGGQGSLRFPDLVGVLPFEPIAGDTATAQELRTFLVDPEAADAVRQIIEPRRGDLELFSLPGLVRITRAVTN